MTRHEKVAASAVRALLSKPGDYTLIGIAATADAAAAKAGHRGKLYYRDNKYMALVHSIIPVLLVNGITVYTTCTRDSTPTVHTRTAIMEQETK